MENLRSPVKTIALVVVVAAGIQGAYVVLRTAQVAWQSFGWWPARIEGKQCPRGIVEARSIVGMLARQRMPGRLPSSAVEDWMSTQAEDADSDGLDSRSELLLMTSDRTADTDEDGVPDPADPCPNGFARSYREKVESAVFSSELRGWEAKNTTVYCVTSFDTYLDIASGGARAVVLSEMALAYLRFETDVFPDKPCRENGYLLAEPFVFVPGLLYVYDLEYDFGGRCGGQLRKLFVDLPILGPTHVFDRWVWIS